MLLTGYQAEVFLPACNAHFQSLHCIARLDEDVGAALPYLNAVLGGEVYIIDPPSVTFSLHGKLVTVHARKIAVNALRDEAEAHSILEWLKKEINEAWENRDTIAPKYEGSEEGPSARDLQAAAPVELQGLRSADLHGLFRACGHRRPGSGGLPCP